MQIINSIALVDRSVRAKVGGTFMRSTAQGLGHASQARRGAGQGSPELVGQRTQLGLGGQWGLSV